MVSPWHLHLDLNNQHVSMLLYELRWLIAALTGDPPPLAPNELEDDDNVAGDV